MGDSSSSSSSDEETAPNVDIEALTPKDASHGAFYAGFAKGAASAVEGMVLFVKTPKLQQIAWEAMGPMCKAQFVYISAALIFIVVFYDFKADFGELFWAISRWGRIVTIALNIILDLFSGANKSMFFAALREKNGDFANALEEMPEIRASFRQKWTNFKRIGKLALFNLTGKLIKWIIPGGKYLAIPVMKFVSMRPVLGNGVAAAVAAVHAMPLDTLESSRVDDILVVFGESVVDADDLGADLTKKYSRRLDEETRTYFGDRYRGYIVGCGFVYGLMSAVPLLGIPMSLIGECGAACLISDIVQRNLEKEARRALPAEELLGRPKTS